MDDLAFEAPNLGTKQGDMIFSDIFSMMIDLLKSSPSSHHLLNIILTNDQIYQMISAFPTDHDGNYELESHHVGFICEFISLLSYSEKDDPILRFESYGLFDLISYAYNEYCINTEFLNEELKHSIL